MITLYGQLLRNPSVVNMWDKEKLIKLIEEMNRRIEILEEEVQVLYDEEAGEDL